MARRFDENDPLKPDWVVPSVDRTSFTVTQALPSRPVDLGGDDDDPEDGATAAFSEPPVKRRHALPKTDRDPDSLTLTVASPAWTSDESRLRQHRRGAPVTPGVMAAPRVVGRYRLSEPIATGGMATVHIGIRDDDGRVYAVKRLHSQFAHDEYFAQMLLDEAAIAARIRHRNVVTMYGAGIVGGDLILVMEYVIGLTVADLIQAVHPQQLPPRILVAIFAGALRGLHAAHEARDEHGRSLDIIHRDVSPQNVHIGADGIARVLDFGIAKAEHRTQTTRAGELKGKMAYMAPEQLTGADVDRRVDVRAAGVVLWEALAAAPLFHAENEGATMTRVLEGCSTPPSRVAQGVPPALDDVVMRALAMHPDDRFGSALEMAEALEDVFAESSAPSHEVAAWLNVVAAENIRDQWNVRAQLLGDARAPSRRPHPASKPSAALSGASASQPVPLPVSSTKLMPLASGDRDAMTARHPTRRPRAAAPTFGTTPPPLAFDQRLALAWQRLPMVSKVAAIVSAVLLTFILATVFFRFVIDDAPETPPAKAGRRG